MTKLYPLTLGAVRELWRKHSIDLQSLTREEVAALLCFAEARLGGEELPPRTVTLEYQWPQDRTCDDDAHPFGGPL